MTSLLRAILKIKIIATLAKTTHGHTPDYRLKKKFNFESFFMETPKVNIHYDINDSCALKWVLCKKHMTPGKRVTAPPLNGLPKIQ